MLYAQFIKHTASAVQHPFFFIVSGNCKRGMICHMVMNPLYYSSLLMTTELIRFKGTTVGFRMDEYKEAFFGKKTI